MYSGDCILVTAHTSHAAHHCSLPFSLNHVQQGITPLANIVRGDFLNMPFEPNTFDGAYAIEATCHAPKVSSRSSLMSCSGL